MKYKNKFTMNQSQAEDTLKNVFSACNIKLKLQENELTNLQKKHDRESRSYHFMMILAGIILLLVLISPLCFHTSPANITPNQSDVCTLEVYEHHIENGVFYLTVHGGTVDYDHITILADDGTSVALLSYDTAASTFSFPYDKQELNIYIPDENGNELQLLLSPKK